MEMVVRGLIICLIVALFTTPSNVAGEIGVNLSRIHRYNESPRVTLTTLLSKHTRCARGVLCVPLIQCPAHVRMTAGEKPPGCHLSGGAIAGICCMTGQNHTDGRSRSRWSRTFHLMSALPLRTVEEARLKFTRLLHGARPLPVSPDRPEFLHNMVFHSSMLGDSINFNLANTAMEQVIISQLVAQKDNFAVEDIATNDLALNLEATPMGQHCFQPVMCYGRDPRYRTFDGTCNNVMEQRTSWGGAGQPMVRLLPPAYLDGIWKPRTHSSDGSLLSSARTVSRMLLPDLNHPHTVYNLLLMQFGQFIAHDMTQAAAFTWENGATVQCCSLNGDRVLPPESAHFACMPIAVDGNDDLYRDFNISCLNFVRLSLAPTGDCHLSYGRQRNKVTHYLDASTVYGSSVEVMRSLREFRGGRLRVSREFGRQMLPMNFGSACGIHTADNETCYISGDGRTNQIISLIALHLMFAREHNRVADALALLNPLWPEELLFQEARRILIAELQHIIYNEYLPAIVGPGRMKAFRLTTRLHGHSAAYQPDVNAAVSNEFAGAAFRMGHSSVDGRFYVRAMKGERRGEVIDIPDVMFNPTRMHQPTFYDDILRTMMEQPMQSVDSSMTRGLTAFLFRGRNAFGLDLAAINIQRGRDHALRSYNDYLELTGQHRIDSFDIFPKEIEWKLARIYRSPNDIDLWIGGLLERPVEDGVVGPTFADIIADQFSRLKNGDRYFYEHDSDTNPGAFDSEQLRQIRKASMARILCDNADHTTLQRVSPAVFIQSAVMGNEPVSCRDLPSIDLNAWRS